MHQYLEMNYEIPTEDINLRHSSPLKSETNSSIIRGKITLGNRLLSQGHRILLIKMTGG